MKRSLFLILAMALVAPLAARQHTAAELFNRALVLERAEGRVAEAVVLYERLVKEFPADKDTVPQALYRLGLAYDAKHDERADAMFGRLAREFANTRYGVEAAQRLGQAPAAPFKISDISNYVLHTRIPTFSDDGTRIAYFVIDEKSSTLHVRDVTNGRDREVGSFPASPLSAKRFSPDGRRIVTVWGGRGSPRNPPDTNLHVIDANGGGPPASIPLAPFLFAGTAPDIGQMPWSPDGSWLPHVAPTADPKVGTVQVWSATNGQTRSLGVTVDAPTAFRWSPDGTQVMFRAQLASQSVDEVRVATIATGASRVVAGPGFTTDGRWTANNQLVLRRIAVGPNAATDVFLAPAAGGSPVKVCTAGNGDQCYVSPTGTFVIRRSAADKRYFYRAVPGGTEQPLTRGSGEESGLVQSEDGRLIYFYSNRDGKWAAYVSTVDRIPIVAPVRLGDVEAGPSGGFLPFTRLSDGVIMQSVQQLANIERLDMTRGTGHAVAGAALERLTQDAEVNNRPAVSPDGMLIAYHFRDRARGGIAVMDAAGVTEKHYDSLPSTGPLFWRSKDEVVFSSGNNRTTFGVSALNVRTGVVTLLKQVPFDGWEYVAGTDEILGVGDRYAPARPDVVESFRVTSLTTGTERTLKTGTMPADEIDLWFVSPDGKQVAYTVMRGDRSELRVMNIDGTGDRAIVPMQKGDMGIAGWSWDGRFLLFDPDYSGERARVIDVASRESWDLPKPLTGWESEGSWAPDGSFLVMTTSAYQQSWRAIRGITYETVSRLMKK